MNRIWNESTPHTINVEYASHQGSEVNDSPGRLAF